MSLVRTLASSATKTRKRHVLFIYFITLRQKLTEMEDRSRRCNIRLVGLAKSAEGENAIQFLQQNLPVWILSLAGEKIEIQRAHRIYTSQDKPSRPRTLIFQLLRYQDRERIFNGVRALATPPTHRASAIFPRLQQRKESLWHREEKDGQQRTTLKVKHNGTLHFFEDVDKAEKFMSTLDRSPHSPPERPSAPGLLPSLRRLTQASLRRLHLLTRDPVCKMFQAGKRGTSRHRLMCLKFQLQTVIATTAVSFIIC